jgi:hypothetical protein
MCEGFSVISLIQGRFALGFAIQKAFLWNFSHLPKTIAVRHDIQRGMRTTPDSVIMGKIMYNPSIRYYFGLMTGHLS